MCDERSKFVITFAGAGIIYTCGKAMLVICSMAIMPVGIQFIRLLHTLESFCGRYVPLWLSREWIRQKISIGLRQESQRKNKV